MRRLASLLSIFVLDACAPSLALRGGGTSDLTDCREETLCPAGGTGDAVTSLAYGVGIAALGAGVGALIYKVVQWRPRVVPGARASRSL